MCHENECKGCVIKMSAGLLELAAAVQGGVITTMHLDPKKM